MLRITRDIYLPGYVVQEAFSKIHIVKNHFWLPEISEIDFEPVKLLQGNRYMGYDLGQLRIEYKVRATALKAAEFVDFAVKAQPMPNGCDWQDHVYPVLLPDELTVALWDTNVLRSALKMVETNNHPSWLDSPIRCEHQHQSYSRHETFIFYYGDGSSDSIVVLRNRYDGRVEIEECSYWNTYRTLEHERRRFFAFQAAMGAVMQLQHIDRHSRSYADAN